MSELAGKRVVVVGLGASGVAAARLCLRRGARVVANDRKPLGALSDEARALEALRRHAGRRRPRPGRACRKPTSSSCRPACLRCRELEAAERAGRRRLGRGRARGPLHGAPRAGRRHRRDQRKEHHDVARRGAARGARACERSSAATSASRLPIAPTSASTSSSSRSRASRWSGSTASGPHVSALLNVTDDHLDRYASFDEYAAAKGNAFVRQTAEDWAVVPAGDALCVREARRGGARLS